MLDRLSARQIEEWIVAETLDADDEREAYENATKRSPSRDDEED